MTAATAGNTSSRSRSLPLWLVAIGAVVVGAIAAELVAVIGRALDVQVIAGDPPAEIPVSGFATATLISGALGVVLALVLAKWAKHPARTWTITTVVLTALSMATPLTAGPVPASSKVLLAVGHLVAAAVIIPVIAWRLQAEEVEHC